MNFPIHSERTAALSARPRVRSRDLPTCRTLQPNVRPVNSGAYIARYLTVTGGESPRNGRTRMRIQHRERGHRGKPGEEVDEIIPEVRHAICFTYFVGIGRQLRRGQRSFVRVNTISRLPERLKNIAAFERGLGEDGLAFSTTVRVPHSKTLLHRRFVVASHFRSNAPSPLQ